MNTDAFFSDTTENYCTPAEPDPGQSVRICFRVAREDRVRVDLIRVLQNEEEAVPMYEMGRDRYFRYFETGPAFPDHSRVPHARLGEGRHHVPDLRGPVLPV